MQTYKIRENYLVFKDDKKFYKLNPYAFEWESFDYTCIDPKGDIGK